MPRYPLSPSRIPANLFCTPKSTSTRCTLTHKNVGIEAFSPRRAPPPTDPLETIEDDSIIDSFAPPTDPLAVLDPVVNSKFDCLSSVPDSVTAGINRIGVIPYCFTHSETGGGYWYALAIDSDYGELTDFGGASSIKDRSIAHTAKRELNEESCGVFSDVTTDTLQHRCPVIVSDKTAVLFLEIEEGLAKKKYGFPYTLQRVFEAGKTRIVSQKRTHRRSKVDEQLFVPTRIETLSTYWVKDSDLTKLSKIGRTLKIFKRPGRLHLSKCEFEDIKDYDFQFKPRYSVAEVVEETGKKQHLITTTVNPLERLFAKEMGDRHPAMYELVRKILLNSIENDGFPGKVLEHKRKTHIEDFQGSCKPPPLPKRARPKHHACNSPRIVIGGRSPRSPRNN